MIDIETQRYDAIVLLGFGGPSSPQEIRPFLDRVLKGRPVSGARYEEVVTHYLQIGGRSPYNERTQQQALALGRVLKERGLKIPVEVAYRNAEPFVGDVMRQLTATLADDVFAIVLSPFQSVASWGNYVRSAEDARREIGYDAPHVDYIDPYFEHPLFVRAHAERLRDAGARFGRSGIGDLDVIFTAHSIPRSIFGADVYARQFARAAESIGRAAGANRWSLAFQSRSGAPTEPWFEPDVRDVLRGLPDRGVREAIVAPIGFLCDHVEVLYDLDIDAKRVAQEAGVRIERASALNDHPLFIEALAELTIASMQRRFRERQER